MDTETLAGKGKQSVPYATAGVLLARGLNVFSVLYIVRNLSTNDWALYSLFLGLLVYMNFFSNLGVAGTLQRFIPDFLAKGYPGATRKVASIALFVRLLVVMSLIAISLLLFRPLSDFLQISGRYLPHYAVFTMAILCFAMSETVTVALQGVFCHKWVALSQGVMFSTRIAGLVWVFHSGYGLMGVMAIEAVCAFLALAVLLSAYRINMPGARAEAGGIVKENFRRMARFTGFNLFYGTGNMFLDPATSLIIISHFLDKTDLALYAFAMRMSVMAFNLLPTMLVQSVVRPMFYTRYAQEGDVSVLQRMFKMLVHLNVFMLAPLFAATFLFGDSLIALLKPEMSTAVTLLMIIAFFNMLRFTELPTDLVLQAIERVDIHLYSRIFSLAAVVGSILVINIWGTPGVAVMFGCGMLAKNLFMYRFGKAYAGLSIEWVAVFRVLANTAVAAACAYPFIGGGIHSLFGLGVFCVVYLMISMLHRTFSPEQRGTLMSIVPRLAFIF